MMCYVPLDREWPLYVTRKRKKSSSFGVEAENELKPHGEPIPPLCRTAVNTEWRRKSRKV